MRPNGRILNPNAVKTNKSEKGRKSAMSPDIAVPLQVLGLGIVISYGIALMIQLIAACLRLFTHKSEKGASGR
jgi:hypothetical protein